MSNAELIERLRKAIYSATAEDAHKAADALELADKRIAEEREQHDIMMERGAEKLAEAERKLAVARQACKDIRRAIERECYAAAYIIVSEALAQIAATEQK